MARPSRRLKVRIFIYGQGLIRGIFNVGGSTIKFDFQKGRGSSFFISKLGYFLTFHTILGKSSNKRRAFYQFMYSTENGLFTLHFILEQLTNK